VDGAAAVALERLLADVVEAGAAVLVADRTGRAFTLSGVVAYELVDGSSCRSHRRSRIRPPP